MSGAVKEQDQARVGGSTQPAAERAPASEMRAAANLRHWQAMARPPASALKTIKGGRLQGMTDVNPQWRYQAMTEQFGACGVGWTYTIDKLWTEPGCDGEVLGFAQVSVRLRTYVSSNPAAADVWSEPIVGIGGNHLIVKETKGLRNNDECWKMAVTDALSVALKMLGVAADVYAGLWDGSKYVEPAAPTPEVPAVPEQVQEWLVDLEAVADEGTPALKAAWEKSPAEWRKWLTSTNNAKWEHLKKRAAMAKVPA